MKENHDARRSLDDEHLSILFQNEEFLSELRHNQEFLSTLHEGSFSVLFVLFFTVESLVIFRSICSINHITFVNTTTNVVASSTEHEAIAAPNPADHRNA